MKQNRSNLALGLILLIIGGWLLVTRQVPSCRHGWRTTSAGPCGSIGAGVLVFLIGLITSTPGMAVPASIIAGIGGILYYQNMTDDFGSWSYMWALIPGFVGVGTILTGLLGEHTRRNVGHGLRLIVTKRGALPDLCLVPRRAVHFG